VSCLSGPLRALTGLPGPAADPLADDDLQLALYLCYELHYGSLDGVDDAWEWEPSLLALRRELESRFEQGLVGAVGEPSSDPIDVVAALRRAMEGDEGPSLSQFLERSASIEQFREFLVHRSAYQLKEADPHTFAIPRLGGAPKAALVEVQADEYGGGMPDRMHSTLFAKAMRALGLDATPGAYLYRIPGLTLATVNLVSMFGLHRRWRGAAAGHLAVFEWQSAIPNRRYGNGLRRLGLGEDATDFFDEHVEADSVHEMIAMYDLAESLAEQEPDLAGTIVFGGRALLELERRFAAHVLSSWDADRSSLLEEPPER